VDALIEVKRRRAAEDPELFAAYRTLAADAQSVVDPSWEAMVPPAVAHIIKTKGLFRTKSVPAQTA
jgi:hypothetical protein